MNADSKRVKHAAYMREYNKRPITHEKKIARDRLYYSKTIEDRRAYDRVRSRNPVRKGAKWLYGKIRRQNPKTKEWQHQYYLRNKDKWKGKKQQTVNRIGIEAYKARQRQYWIKNKYGIGLDQWNRMLREQSGRCAICGQEPLGSTRTFHVDHDHVTGKIRGLLCMHCNHAIERIDRIPQWLEKAEFYWKRPR